MSSLLSILQTDCEARLKAAPYFADVAIILQRTGVTEKEIQRLLNVQAGRGGKVGAAVLVLMPVADVADTEVPGPRLGLTQSFIILTHPTINAGTIGTGKDAEEIALKVLQLFHHCQFGYGQALVGGQSAIVPNDNFDGLVGYQVNVSTFGGPVALPVVVTPTITATGSATPATVTLTTATSGAAIWYTTDGSYPSSANAAATLYTAPFNQATAATVRAAAQKSGMQQSNLRQLTLA